MRHVYALLLDALEHAAGALLWAIGNALERLGMLGGEDE